MTVVRQRSNRVRGRGAHAKVKSRVKTEASEAIETPGGAPYRRRVPAFRAEVDKASGATEVSVTGIKSDRSDFPRTYQPGHPAADANGYVLMPNVNALTEAADMKAAQRSYEANLNAIEAARSLTMRTIDLLK